MNQQLETLEQVFGPMIFTYTRAQAIEDGVLINVSDMAKEAGIKFHTAITATVYAQYVQVPADLKHMEDESGRLWDIIWMFAVAVRRGQLQHTDGTFEVLVSKSLDSKRTSHYRSPPFEPSLQQN